MNIPKNLRTLKTNFEKADGLGIRVLVQISNIKKLKVEVSDFIQLFEDVSKLKIPSDITTPLNTTLKIACTCSKDKVGFLLHS